MKRKQSRLTDLSSDVLRHIMNYVAISSDGAASIARALSVCRMFKDLAEDTDILKAVVFDDLKLSDIRDIHESFWKLNGLLARCVSNGNVTALDILEEYEEKLNEYFAMYNRALFSGRMVLMVRSRAVETRNTRARLKALKSAIEECCKLNETIDVDIQRFMQIIQFLKYVERCYFQKSGE